MLWHGLRWFALHLHPWRPQRGPRDFYHGLLEKAEIEDFRFHDLRHTFASHLVMNGVDIRTVSELIGHSSITMTMKYAHLAPDSRLHAVQTLASAYQTVPKTTSPQISGKHQSL